MIKAIIFDCFNVVVGDGTKHLLEAMSIHSPERRDEFSAVTHAVDKGIIADNEGVIAQSDLLGIPVEEFVALRNSGEVRNEPLITYIQSLKGRYKLGMLSNIVSRDRLDARFLPGQLDQLFDSVVASGDVGHIKPEPGIYEIIAMRLGVDPTECVFIDDIEAFCEGAKQVGMQAIHFTDTNQAIADLKHVIDRGSKSD